MPTRKGQVCWRQAQRRQIIEPHQSQAWAMIEMSQSGRASQCRTLSPWWQEKVQSPRRATLAPTSPNRHINATRMRSH